MSTTPLGSDGLPLREISPHTLGKFDRHRGYCVTTSQNSTVTTFRCSADPMPTATPHASQNLAASLFS